MRLRLTAALLLLVLGAPAVARADDYDRAIDDAVSEFDAGHFEEALAAFEQAYKAKPSARALRGVAKTLFELRLYVRCISTIDRALASEVNPLTGALRTDLEELRERARRFVGRAVIEVRPAGATALLDGQPIDVGSTVERSLEVGPHTLEVSAEEHHPARRSFEVRGGESARISVTLQPARTVVGSAPESNRTPLVLALGALALSGGGVVASSIWFVDRGTAVDRCTVAAQEGSRCANADSVAFQRDASTWTLGVSAVAMVASAVALVFALRPGASARGAAAACARGAAAACAPIPGGLGCGAGHAW